MHPFGKEPNQQSQQHHCADIRTNPFVSVIVRFLSRAHQDHPIFHPRSPLYDRVSHYPHTTLAILSNINDEFIQPHRRYYKSTVIMALKAPEANC